MPLCSFEGCFNGSRKKDHKKRTNVHLHKFPKDFELRRKWFDQIKRGSNVTKVNFETGVVCSDHFSSDCIAPKTFVQETAGYSSLNRRRLLPNVVPLSTFGYYYDDIPYNRMSSKNNYNSPSRSNSPSYVISTPSGPFTVIKAEKTIEFSPSTQEKSLCCSNFPSFDKLCDEVGVQPLCDVKTSKNSNEEFQKNF